MKFYILLFVVMSSMLGCVDTSPESYAERQKNRYHEVLKEQYFIDTAKSRAGEWVVVDIFITPDDSNYPRTYVLERKNPFSRFSLRSAALEKFGPAVLDGNSLLMGDRILITPRTPTLEQYEHAYQSFPDFSITWEERWGYHAKLEFKRGAK